MRNLKYGNKTNERWRTADTVERLTTEEKEYTYSYSDGINLVLMDPETLRGSTCPGRSDGRRGAVPAGPDEAGGRSGRRRPGRRSICRRRVTLEVVEADPVVKGQTASSSYKPARLSNGVKTMVPPFIESGERIVVRTEDASYVERAKG